MGDVPVAHALLALAGSSLPRVTSLAVLRAVASLSRDASAAASMRRAGAVPKLARFLQWEDPETRDVAFRALRNVCASSRAGAEQAAVAGAVPHLVAIAAPEPEVADRSGNNAEDADVSDAGRDSHAETTRRGVLGANGDGAHWLRGDGAAAATSPVRSRRRFCVTWRPRREKRVKNSPNAARWTRTCVFFAATPVDPPPPTPPGRYRRGRMTNRGSWRRN